MIPAIGSSSIQAAQAAPTLSPSGLGATGSAQEPSFKNLLLEGLDQVNAMQTEADQAVEQLITGGDVNPAEVMTAFKKAEISFRMMMQMRNKLVQAYQEIRDIRV